MIRTNYKNPWMLAAILFCGLIMTSCNDVPDVLDNPTKTEKEQASAKDPGKWWIDESYMDKSVKPGDNFFMYCNGTWWKNTTVDPTEHFISRIYLMKPTFERVNSLTDDNYSRYKSHLKWAIKIPEQFVMCFKHKRHHANGNSYQHHNVIYARCIAFLISWIYKSEDSIPYLHSF